MARKRKKQYEMKPEEIKLKKTLFYKLILDLERLARLRKIKLILNMQKYKQFIKSRLYLYSIRCIF